MLFRSAVNVSAAGASPAEVVFYYKHNPPTPEPIPNAWVKVRYLDIDTQQPVATEQDKELPAGDHTVVAEPYDLQPNYVPQEPQSQAVNVSAAGANPAEVVFYYKHNPPTPEPIPNAWVKVRYLDIDTQQPVATEQDKELSAGDHTVVAEPYDLQQIGRASCRERV